jgi:hypothetical protein
LRSIRRSRSCASSRSTRPGNSTSTTWASRSIGSIASIEALHRELAAKVYRYLRPGVERAPWGARVMEVTDPFGNRIRFNEDD